MRSQVCTRILLVSFVVWFIILLFAARHLSSLKSGHGVEEDSKSGEIKNRIETALKKLHILQQHSENIKTVFKDM